MDQLVKKYTSTTFGRIISKLESLDSSADKFMQCLRKMAGRFDQRL